MKIPDDLAELLMEARRECIRSGRRCDICGQPFTDDDELAFGFVDGRPDAVVHSRCRAPQPWAFSLTIRDQHQVSRTYDPGPPHPEDPHA